MSEYDLIHCPTCIFVCIICKLWFWYSVSEMFVTNFLESQFQAQQASSTGLLTVTTLKSNTVIHAHRSNIQSNSKQDYSPQRPRHEEPCHGLCKTVGWTCHVMKDPSWAPLVFMSSVLSSKDGGI
jgi:hypothetical protein